MNRDSNTNKDNNNKDEKLINKLKFLDILKQYSGPPIPQSAISTVASSIASKDSLRLTDEEILSIARLTSFPEFKLLQKVLLENYVILCTELPLIPSSTLLEATLTLRAYHQLLTLLLTTTSRAIDHVQDAFQSDNLPI